MYQSFLRPYRSKRFLLSWTHRHRTDNTRLRNWRQCKLLRRILDARDAIANSLTEGAPWGQTNSLSWSSVGWLDGKDTDTHQMHLHERCDAYRLLRSDDEIQCTADFTVDAHALLADYIVPWPRRVLSRGGLCFGCQKCTSDDCEVHQNQKGMISVWYLAL